MKQCYDWKENRLTVEDIYGNIFDLKFKGQKTVVGGRSGTGKTFLCTILNKLESVEDSDKIYDTSNIVLIDKRNVGILETFVNKLIIIDRSELVLDSKKVEFINDDFNKNRYLIFVRKHIGIILSPNYYANILRRDNKFELKYEFNVKGWN